MLALLALLALPLAAQNLTEELIHNRAAWVLSNSIIRIAVLRGGGHLAEVRLISTDPKRSINPMRVPHYPTIDPHTYDPVKHDAIYGNDSHRWLSSGYMGHLLCFPFYGPPSSDDEKQAGLGNHGEAPIVEWKQIALTRTGSAITFRYGADLPKTQYRVERIITLHKGANYARIEEAVTNFASYDRPFQWMQHATFGPPFVEPGKTYLDTSATRGLTATRADGKGSLASASQVQWPNGTGHNGAPVNLRAMQTKPNAGSYTALLADPARNEQFFAMYHSGYRVLIGYLFPTKENPWIADWQENKSNTILPWNNQVIARGIEFGNSPFAEGLRGAIKRGSLFDTPAYSWIGARQTLKNEFSVFLMEIPEQYNGVKDIKIVNSQIRKQDR
ncbi:MAG: hypothetical protein HY820_39030 [Acidobacteria bacterium]|nr:hypothetical protein [Acidobacteriota bacterium]